jgi:hypothetical protein
VIEYPHDGEVFLIGSTIAVVWYDEQSELAKQYQIWLSTDGGITYPKLLAASVPNSEATWDWNDADVIGNHLCVRVNAVREEAVITGAGSQPFTVTVPPLLTVQSPNEGARWRFGMANTVAWSNIGTAPIHYAIELYRGDARDAEWVETLASDLPGTAANWTWTDDGRVEDVTSPGNNFRVKVVGSFSQGEVVAWSPGSLSLSPSAVVTVDSVAEEGRAWHEGDDIPIAWQSSQDGAIRYTVQLCMDKTSEGTTLAFNLPGETHGWTWSGAGPPGSYFIRVVAYYPEGDIAGYSPSRFEIERQLGGREAAAASQAAARDGDQPNIRLNQNYPNPFNALTTISFDLRTATNIRLTVYNTLGQQVALLLDGPMQPGRHQAQFDGARLASGVYIYRLQAGGQVVQKQMLLTK